VTFDEDENGFSTIMGGGGGGGFKICFNPVDMM
jgi:hypothetical protein